MVYDYTQTPPGYGDTFFMFAYNGDSLTNGTSPSLVALPITNGDFICRYWSGLESIADGIQLYDAVQRRWFGDVVNWGATSGFATGCVVLPERRYPNQSYIRFDLSNVTKATVGTDGALTIYRSQLVFAGVKRRANHYSDPEPSPYPFREREIVLGQNGQPGTFLLSINKYASTNGVLNPPDQYSIPVLDYDFELRRVELQLQSDGQLSQFAITLYDNYWNPVSNVPILANRFFHLDNNHSSGEQNFFPSPGLLYKVGSVIRFDIWSLLVSPTALPQEFRLAFYGVRRIPCR